MTKKDAPSHITRFVIYPIVGSIFLFILGVLILMANGYNFSLKDGRIQMKKTGMIITGSKPAEARIWLDGEDTEKNTLFTFLNVELRNLFPKEYLLEIKKDGFKTWSKLITVKPNLVSWANYALLYPNKLEVEAIDELSGYSLVAYDDEKNKVMLKKIDPTTNQRQYFLYKPSDKDLKKLNFEGKINLVTLNILPGYFSPDGKKYLYSDQSTSYYLNLDVDKILPTAITPMNGMQPTNIKFGKDNNLYGIFDNTLYQMDFKDDGTIGYNKILEKVVEYEPGVINGHIVILAESKNNKIARYGFDGKNEKIILDNLVKSDRYFIDYSNKYDVYSILMPEIGDFVLLSEKNGSKAIMQLEDQVTAAEWQESEERLAYYSGNGVYVYDWQKEEKYHFTIDHEVIGLNWYYDNSHLVVRTDAGIYITDYDGYNKELISSTHLSFFNYNRDDFFLENNDGLFQRLEFDF